MGRQLRDYQEEAILKLQNGSILCGGVGSGKSMTSIAYYATICGRPLDDLYGPLSTPIDLYIITTARKRDTFEWDGECSNFALSTKEGLGQVNVFIDSWNNIKKYDKVFGAFFIFDEQRLVGSGSWVKAFLKIAKKNKWILLSATPADVWLDYVPVFIANGFYKNRTEFLTNHVVYNRFCKYPQIDHYIETGILIKHQRQILVGMKYKSPTIHHKKNVFVQYDKVMYDKAAKQRWNDYTNEPVKDASSLCYLLRKITNSDPSRIEAVRKIIKDTPKLIIFYNFNYELNLLRELSIELNIPTGEWNGHLHQSIPETDTWLYLCQYTSAAEGWNNTSTNTILFFSQNYSYKIMTQAAGRIDRMNTPFKELYYKYLISGSPIDIGIMKSISKKQSFNESGFLNKGVNKSQYKINEVWKEVVGYEGLYEVSSYGNIFSCKRDKELSLSTDKDGYKKIHLYKNGIALTYRVHRLVGNAFIPNTNNLPVINHKNENPSDNHIDNLEWCTCLYNNNYGTHNDNVSKALTNYEKTSKPVVGINIINGLILEFPSAKEAGRNGFSQGTLSNCCRKLIKSYRGFTWAYVSK